MAEELSLQLAVLCLAHYTAEKKRTIPGRELKTRNKYPFTTLNSQLIPKILLTVQRRPNLEGLLNIPDFFFKSLWSESQKARFSDPNQDMLYKITYNLDSFVSL